MSSLPLIFTHYGNSFYLKYTLLQAKKSNPQKRCILLGDSSNRDLALSLNWEHNELRSLKSDKRDKFNSVFYWVQGPEHNAVSGNKDWLRYVSERFFALEVYLIKEKINNFWHFDSDTMIVHNLDKFEKNLIKKKIECTTLCNGACPSGYITSSLILNYCNSMIDDYNDIDFLESQQKEFDTKNRNYAFTEMRAFERFKSKYSLNPPRLSSYFNHIGIWFDDAICQEHNFKMLHADRLEKKIKNIMSKNGEFYCENVYNKIYKFATINCSWVGEGVFKWILKSYSMESNITNNLPDHLKFNLKEKIKNICVHLIKNFFRKLLSSLFLAKK